MEAAAVEFTQREGRETSRLGPYIIQAPRAYNDPIPAVCGHPGARVICYLMCNLSRALVLRVDGNTLIYLMFMP